MKKNIRIREEKEAIHYYKEYVNLMQKALQCRCMESAASKIIDLVNEMQDMDFLDIYWVRSPLTCIEFIKKGNTYSVTKEDLINAFGKIKSLSIAKEQKKWDDEQDALYSSSRDDIR